MKNFNKRTTTRCTHQKNRRHHPYRDKLTSAAAKILKNQGVKNFTLVALPSAHELPSHMNIPLHIFHTWMPPTLTHEFAWMRIVPKTAKKPSVNLNCSFDEPPTRSRRRNWTLNPVADLHWIARDVPPPPRAQNSFFIFGKNWPNNRLAPPPWELAPPGEILDTPLNSV